MKSSKSLLSTFFFVSFAFQRKVEGINSVAFSLEDECYVPLVQKSKGALNGGDLSFYEFLEVLKQYHSRRDDLPPWNDVSMRTFMRPTFVRLASTYCVEVLKMPTERCNAAIIQIPQSLHDRGKDSTSYLTQEEILYTFSVCEEGYRSVNMINFPSFEGIFSITAYTPRPLQEFLDSIESSWRNICDDIVVVLNRRGSNAYLHDTSVQNYERDATSCRDEGRNQMNLDQSLPEYDFVCYRVTLYVHVLLGHGLDTDVWSPIFFNGVEEKMKKVGAFDDCENVDTCVFKRFYSDTDEIIEQRKNVAIGISFFVAIFIMLVVAKLMYDKRTLSLCGSKFNTFPIAIPDISYDGEDILIEGGTIEKVKEFPPKNDISHRHDFNVLITQMPDEERHIEGHQMESYIHCSRQCSSSDGQMKSTNIERYTHTQVLLCEPHGDLSLSLRSSVSIVMGSF